MVRTSILLMVVVLLIGAGSISAQDAPPSGPPLGRPPLVECVDGESIPCVEIVTQAEQLTGTWRRFVEHTAEVLSMEVDENGAYTLDVRGEHDRVGSIAFDNGVALITTYQNETGIPPECITPGTYEIRRIRLGDQPVALTLLLVEDPCRWRPFDFSYPMLYYDIAENGLPEAGAYQERIRALVPCPEDAGEHAYPCDVVAASPEDVAGVWRQYMGNPAFGAPNGMGFSRFNPDGSFQLGVTAEDTSAAETALPTGSISFEGTELTLLVDGDAPPECKSASYRFRVIRVGDQPVALHPEPIRDECVRRRDGDMAEAQIWVVPAASHAQLDDHCLVTTAYLYLPPVKTLQMVAVFPWERPCDVR